MVKHSVILLTYNQEDTVQRSLDSIFSQSVLPYEVIIGDDSSIDGTYAILKKYELRFPEIVKLYSYPENIGIFPNQNFLMEKVSGNIVSFLAGDDRFKDGLFQELNRQVVENDIDLNSDFVIVTNVTSIDTKGKEVLWDNFKSRNRNPFKERLRYSINYRSVGISASLLKKAGPIVENIGYHADWIWCLKIDALCNRHYYTTFVSSEYYIGLGVVSKTDRNLLAQSMFAAIDIIKNEFKNVLDIDDILYLDLVKKHETYQIKPTFKNYFIFLLTFIKNISNIDKNNYIMNFKSIFPKQMLKVLIYIKSLIKF